MDELQDFDPREMFRERGFSGHELARRYYETYPWSDLNALRITIRIREATESGRAAFARCLSSLGMRSMPRYLVLLHLHFSDESRLTHYDLSRRLNISSPSVSSLINGLEEEQLVRRVINPANRRETYVELTDQGRVVCERVVPEAAQFSTTLREEFSAEELIQFSEYLDRFQRWAGRRFPTEG